MALALRLTLCARCPAKSSVQSWFSGSKPLSFRYAAHRSSCFQYRPAKSALPLHLRDGGQQDQQISALFHRHLVLFRPFAAPIDLAIGVRICAEIVGSERECPALGRRVVHERHEKRLGQRRTEQQELGRHRIEHIGRADAAVRVVLLAELQAACPCSSATNLPAAKHWR